MTELSFPTNPNDGDLYVFGDKTYIYVANNDQWKISTSTSSDANLASLRQSIIPRFDGQISLGSPNKKWKDVYVSANTLYIGDANVTSSNATSITIPPDSQLGDEPVGVGRGVKSYANTTLFPASGEIGDLAFAENTKRCYLWNGLVWFHVFNASTTNDAPYITSLDPKNIYYLNGTTGANVEVEIIAQDPEEGSLTFDYDVTSGTLGGTSVTQSNNVFTITPSSDTNDVGIFELTFSVTDGLHIANRTSLFSLKFALDWSVWTDLDNFVGANTVPNSYYGTRLHMDSYNLIVGASNDSGDQSTGEGCIYIYNIEDTLNIGQSQVIKSPGSGAGDWGDRMAYSSNTLVCGTQAMDSPATNGGAVYVYHRSTDGIFTELQTCQPGNNVGGIASAAYGKDVVISDDGLKMFVASSWTGSGTGTDTVGSVDYWTRDTVGEVFTYHSNMRTQTDKFNYGSGIGNITYNDKWNELFISYPNADKDSGSTNTGQIFVMEFDESTNQWIQKQFIQPGQWGHPVYYYTNAASNFDNHTMGQVMATRGDILLSNARESDSFGEDIDVMSYRDTDGYWKKFWDNFTTDNVSYDSANPWGQISFEDDTYVYFYSGKRNYSSNRGVITYIRVKKSDRSTTGTTKYWKTGPSASSSWSASIAVDTFRGLAAVGAMYDDLTGMTNRGRVWLYEV